MSDSKTEAKAQAKKEELELAAACKEIAEVSQAKRAAQPTETRPPQKCSHDGCGHDEIAHTHFDDPDCGVCKWCYCTFYCPARAATPVEPPKCDCPGDECLVYHPPTTEPVK